jgi:anaerobic magnesium-protoporphyrin IX monomethyl ester cyclase
VLADRRLGGLAMTSFDTDTRTDAWWIAYRIIGMAPDVVALPVMCWTARTVYEVARIVTAELPSTRVVLGGPEAGPLAADILAAQVAIDAVVVGEGEQSFCDLLDQYRRGAQDSVAGVVRRIGEEIVAGPARRPVDDLDALPTPHLRADVATDGSAYIETYRGCPHACAYCFEGKGSTRIRSYSWDRIARDIETVAGAPGMRAFSFIDPVFNLTRDRLGRLADLLEPHARRGVRLHTIEVDIESIDDEQAALLRRAGVASVETGPQTTNPKALELCGRRFDPDRFSDGVAACKRAGISVECDLIIGLPCDTSESVLRSIDFVMALDPGVIQASTLHVLPGTALWERADDLGLRFDASPPHELISTPDIGYRDLRRLEALGAATAVAYRARFDHQRSDR